MLLLNITKYIYIYIYKPAILAISSNLERKNDSYFSYVFQRPLEILYLLVAVFDSFAFPFDLFLLADTFFDNTRSLETTLFRPLYFF